MTRYGRHISAALFLAFLLFITSCTQERQPCLTPTTASLNIRALQFKTGVTDAVDSALPAAFFRAITYTGTKGFIFGRQSTFSIWLSTVADSTMWLVSTDTTSTAAPASDTIIFRYSRNQFFVSNACGFTYFFNLNSVSTTHQFIDSIRVINSNVTNNVNAGNVQIYIHPGT